MQYDEILRKRASWGFTLGLGALSMALGSVFSIFSLSSDISALEQRVVYLEEVTQSLTDIAKDNVDNTGKLAETIKIMLEGIRGKNYAESH